LSGWTWGLDDERDGLAAGEIFDHLLIGLGHGLLEVLAQRDDAVWASAGENMRYPSAGEPLDPRVAVLFDPCHSSRSKEHWHSAIVRPFTGLRKDGCPTAVARGVR
jgi:hypothetical protein